MKQVPALPQKSAGLRLLRVAAVLVGLGIWFGTQALLGARPPLPPEEAKSAGALLTHHDGLLKLAAPVNESLRAHRAWADGLLIVSSTFINLFGIFLLGWTVFGPSLRPFLGLLILFSLRQVLQALTALPPPEGMIWHDPGVPGGLVTYDVGNDLFFSGHTALAVYGAIELGRFRRWLIPVAAAIALFEVAAVLVLRAHYTMDVFAGAITALFVAGVAGKLAPPCDRALVRLFGSTGGQ